MHLFDVLPDRLFSVLASPNRVLYADLLMDLYQLFEAHRFGIAREVLMDSLMMQIESWQSISWKPDSPRLPEEEDAARAVGLARNGALPDSHRFNGGAFEDEDSFPMNLSVREQAAAVLRKLEETGWLEVEMRTNYEQYITLPDYAITLLQALDRVRSPRPVEYRGYVYATYAALSVQDVEQEGFLALTKAYEQTEQLIRELKSLNSNIRRYTERLARHKLPQEILAAHFLDYRSQILDRSYHQLKTSDNVAKYRPRILQRINDWLRDPGWVLEVARSALRSGYEEGLEAAQHTIQERLRFIEKAYQEMDELLDEIDRRNAQYARASLEQIRYLLNSSKDTEGQLKDLLVFLAGRLREGAWERSDDAVRLEALLPVLGGDWEGLFHLYTAELLEDESLFTPRQSRRPHRSQPLSIEPVGEPARQRAARRLRQQLQRQMSPARIEAFVLEQLGERRQMKAHELPLERMDDFVRMIFIAAYGRRRQSAYQAGPDDSGGAQQTVSGNGLFEVPDITIRKK